MLHLYRVIQPQIIKIYPRTSLVELVGSEARHCTAKGGHRQTNTLFVEASSSLSDFIWSHLVCPDKCLLLAKACERAQ